VQAQILNLLRNLQDRFGLTYLFISHNIAVTGFMSKRIGVMYLGRMMEIAPSLTIVRKPSHPYTQALISAVPEPDPAKSGKQRALTGDVPSPIDRPSGCSFHPRCPLAKRMNNPERCHDEEPQMRELSPGHTVACHFAEEK
jgi:oligopeptide/dipeptide ABC transporter ATP-binding protein